MSTMHSRIATNYTLQKMQQNY